MFLPPLKIVAIWKNVFVENFTILYRSMTFWKLSHRKNLYNLRTFSCDDLLRLSTLLFKTGLLWHSGVTNLIVVAVNNFNIFQRSVTTVQYQVWGVLFLRPLKTVAIWKNIFVENFTILRNWQLLVLCHLTNPLESMTFLTITLFTTFCYLSAIYFVCSHMKIVSHRKKLYNLKKCSSNDLLRLSTKQIFRQKYYITYLNNNFFVRGNPQYNSIQVNSCALFLT